MSENEQSAPDEPTTEEVTEQPANEAATAQKPKSVPWIHMGLCLLLLLGFIGWIISRMASNELVIEEESIWRTLIPAVNVTSMVLYGLASLLLLMRRPAYVWFFLAPLALIVPMELIFHMPTDPKADFTFDVYTNLGIIYLAYILLIPLFGSLSDRLKPVDTTPPFLIPTPAATE